MSAGPPGWSRSQRLENGFKILAHSVKSHLHPPPKTCPELRQPVGSPTGAQGKGEGREMGEHSLWPQIPTPLRPSNWDS